MNCLHVNTVDTGWKESIWICQHCRYRFIWYSKCFYSKDELPSCRHCRYKSRMDSKQRYRFIWYSKCFYSKDELSSCLHCRYWMKGIHPNMSTLENLQSGWYRFIWYSKCFYSKDELPSCQHREWIWSKDTGSSGIRNVSTQKMNCLHVYTVDTGWKESIRICQHCRYRFIWYSKCFYSKDELPSCRHCRYTSRMDSKQIYEFHPVFEMYYWRQRACRHCRYKVVWVENLQYWMKGIHPNMSTLSIQGCLSRKSSIQHCWYRFIWYSKCFYSKDELPSCQHCRYWMKGIHLNMSTLSIQVHLVFEMFLLKRWTAFMSTLSIQIENGFEAKIQVHLVFEMFLLKRWTVFMSTLFILDERNPSEYVNTVDTGSSGIRNVSTQKMNCLHVNTVDTGWKESIENMSTLSIQVHLVFEMFLLKNVHVLSMKKIQSKYTSFIQYSKCTMSTLSIQGCLSRKSSILDERNPSEYVDTVDTRLFE